MRSTPTQSQLLLFPGAPAPGDAQTAGGQVAAGRPPRRRRLSPAARKAAALDRLAEAAERELAEAWRAGDAMGARAAHERARGARRAAELLRAGPSGVAEVLGGHHEAA
ncbi:hypothetical protein [Miltoncostaea marina]|uniref:hypothetical protein n=1 Tax=Miltoncostaea marina TaxID=2843215 RepID=UPI001C3D0843|nr:hypothetical protein [Miltoncostaea marina]